MHLKTKIIKGGFALMVANIVTQVLSFGFNVLLTRLLNPQDFGIIAIAIFFIVFTGYFTTVSFGSAIIHYQENDNEKLSSIYWVNFLFFTFAALLLNILSPVIAIYYSEPQLRFVLHLLSVNYLLTPFYIVHYKLLEKEMQFVILSKINIASVLSGYIVAVIVAFLGFGVFSLAIQSVFTTLMKVILIQVFGTTWKPARYISLKKIYNMIWYAIKYQFSTAFLYIERNIDYLIIGKLLNSTALGFYSFAYNIMYVPIKNISYLFGEVLFPSFSAVKDDYLQLKKIFFQSTGIVSAVTFPAMTLVALNATLIVSTVFGEKWLEAVPVVQVLSFAGAVQSVGQFGGANAIFPGIGKPEVNFYISIFRALLITAAVLAGSRYGLVTIAIFILLASFISSLILFIMLYRYLKFGLKDLVVAFNSGVISVALLFITAFVFNILSSDLFQVVKFIVMLCVASGVFYYYNAKVIRQIINVLKTKGILSKTLPAEN
ncbi:MAG: lipopolysaccharide biosynthesis protein [Ignavibacteria bacterium]